jgi:hypothetical protein
MLNRLFIGFLETVFSLLYFGIFIELSIEDCFDLI